MTSRTATTAAGASPLSNLAAAPNVARGSSTRPRASAAAGQFRQVLADAAPKRAADPKGKTEPKKSEATARAAEKEKGVQKRKADAKARSERNRRPDDAVAETANKDSSSPIDASDAKNEALPPVDSETSVGEDGTAAGVDSEEQAEDGAEAAAELLAGAVVVPAAPLPQETLDPTALTDASEGAATEGLATVTRPTAPDDLERSLIGGGDSDDGDNGISLDGLGDLLPDAGSTELSSALSGAEQATGAAPQTKQSGSRAEKEALRVREADGALAVEGTSEEGTEEQPLETPTHLDSEGGASKGGDGSPTTAGSHPAKTSPTEAGNAVHVAANSTQPSAERSSGPSPLSPLPAEPRFADDNHPRVVDVVRTQLLPKGGSVEIRLDPPELGALQVKIDVRDGVVTASFQTSNDEATRLLSHTLEQLRHTLETRGVTVDKLQVQQLPKDGNASAGDNPGQNPQGNSQPSHQQQQDQQRRELLERMWRRIAIGRDEFDAIA